MKRSELIANLALIFGLPFLGVAAGCVIPFLVNAPLKSTFIMLLFWVLGFSFFFKAKVSVIKLGNLISFGASEMSRVNRICYILGYVLMGVGLIFSLVIIVFYR